MIDIKVDSIGEKNIYKKYMFYLENNINMISNEVSSLDGEGIQQIFFEIREYMLSSLVEFLIDANQYIYIDEDFKRNLNSIYNKYLVNILKLIIKKDIENIKMDFKRMDLDLKCYLYSFEEISKIRNTEEKIPNFEYSAEEQIEILGVDEIKEPLLDLGCGKNYNLVKELRKRNIEAYGIDRYDYNEKFLYNESWLDFDFKSEKYSTVIANMSFSNHFIRENLKKEGLYKKYARTYMDILKSLKVGGSFYYSPDLEFIEEMLDREKFKVRYLELENGYKSVKITKIRI